MLLTSLGGKSFAQTPNTSPLNITGVNIGGRVGLNELLKVQLDGTAVLDPTKYVLFIDGRPINGLDETLFDGRTHAFIFRLRRNDANAAAWKALLGSPNAFTQRVTVALGEAPSQGLPPSPTIFGNGTNDTLDLVVIYGPKALVALIAEVRSKSGYAVPGHVFRPHA